MNNFQLKNIKINNFKGIANFDYEFSKGLTQLIAKSGAGKTSIIEAINWIFGKTIDDIFPILNENAGWLVKDVETNCSITIEKNGMEYTLCRKSNQKWKENKYTGDLEFMGNESVYYFDGLESALKDYKQKLETLFETKYENLAMLVDITLFNEMKWQDQRKFLFEHTGVENQVSNLQTNEKYNLLKPNLEKGLDETDIQKMLNAQKKQIKDEQERNMAVIESRAKEIAELSSIDYDAIEKHKNELNTEIDTLQAQNNQGKVNTLLEEKQTEFEQIRAKFNEVSRDVSNKKEKRASEQNSFYMQCSNINRDIEFCKNKLKRLTDDIEDYKIEAEDLASQEFDQEKTICPTCKQTLPTERIKELKANFATDKERRLADINSKVENSLVEQQNTENKINTLTEQLKAVESDLEALNNEVVDTTLYDDLQKQLNDKKQEIELITSDGTDIDVATIEKITLLKNEYEQCIRELTKKDQLAKLQTEVANLKAKNRELATQDAERIKKQDQLSQYIQDKIALVNDTVNSFFDGVEFNFFSWNTANAESLFSMTCEVMLDGIGYSKLSTGEKIRANILTVKGLSKLLGIEMFTIVDEAGSTSYDYESGNQTIVLLTLNKFWEDNGIKANFNPLKIKDTYTINDCHINK